MVGMTNAAVLQFQEDNQLIADGIVGNQTFTVITATVQANQMYDQSSDYVTYMFRVQ